MDFVRLSDDFPAAPPCALQQSQTYARTVSNLGADVVSLSAREGSTEIARVQIIRRRCGPVNLFWLPRGPVWRPGVPGSARAEVMAGLPRTMRTKGVWLVAPDSPCDTGLFRHGRLLTPQYVAEIDLTAAPETQLAAQHGKWRNRLRHAQKSGLRVVSRPAKFPRDTALLSHEAAQQKQRRYRALPPAFALAWVQAFPGAARLFTVLKGRDTLAQMLVLLHAPVATYHIGWNSEDGRRVSAHNLALWEASRWLARHGYMRFDLGSVDTQHASGLARFKIGSGATIRPLGPTCLFLPRLSFPRRLRNAAA